MSQAKFSPSKNKIAISQEANRASVSGTALKVSPVAQTPVEGREPRKTRRRLTGEYKLRILKEIDACRGQTGAIGELLRREGLYSSCVTEWRKQRELGKLTALGIKRGRKPLHSPEQTENESLRKEITRLQKRLDQSEKIIEIQKKVAALLGNPIDD